MNGRTMLLILAHLFRTHGENITIEDAVRFLSFKCRYGRPSHVRKMLTLAKDNEMITREEDNIVAGFPFDKQILSPLQVSSSDFRVAIHDDTQQME